MLSISSRNSEPPSACSILPMRRLPAPVKALASWPKISLSNRLFDQHVGAGVGDVGDQLAQLLHGRRAANDALLQGLAPGQLAAQGADLAGQTALFEGAAHHLDQALGREGFLDEVVGTVAHGAHGHADVAVAGDQHHRQARVAAFELGQQLQAIDARQADIADDYAGEVAVDPGQRLLGAADAGAGDILQLQRLLAAEQHVGVVLDDQYGQRFSHRGAPQAAVRE
jgi:hypothetical protein